MLFSLGAVQRGAKYNLLRRTANAHPLHRGSSARKS